jgi:hypothetical protein
MMKDPATMPFSSRIQAATVWKFATESRLDNNLATTAEKPEADGPLASGVLSTYLAWISSLNCEVPASVETVTGTEPG